MKRLKAILLTLLYSLFIITGNTTAQTIEHASLSGTVTDSTTNSPLLGAHVFLSGTTIGTSTDPGGNFTLNNLPPGAHTLTISIIGYGRSSKDIVLKAGQDTTINRKLEPVIYDLGELYVGNLDDRWERYLARFKELFIGSSARADSVSILNPEVLRFETRWWGRFTAEALAPLQIENRATGYRIIYHLDDFYHSGSITRWDGDSFFTPLSPADSIQQNYWAIQRQDAFMGSLRHFFLSLVNSQLENQDFSIYMQSQQIHGYSTSNRRRVSNQRLIRDTDEQGQFHISYYGVLEIIYRGSGEDPLYPRWARKRRGTASMQTSWLELEKRPITIDSNGEIMETYAATRMGYMAFQRFAEALPKDYRPENWDVVDNS